MRTRILALMELALIFPAALFMTALLLRNLQPGHEPAHSAQQFVMWYAGRMWTLWLLLLALPLVVLVSGCVALLSRWNAVPHSVGEFLTMVRSDTLTLLITATTLAAGIILAIAVLHMLAN